MPLRSTLRSRRKSGDLNPDVSSSEDEHLRYRDNPQKPKTQQINDSDLEVLSDSSVDNWEQPGTIDEHVRRHNAEITRRLDSEPGNPEIWMQLIRNQDKSLKSRPTEAERRSNADIKISLYEKALHSVQTPECRQDLLLGMMEEGAKVWDSDRLAAQWSSTLKKYPHVSKLWTKFLEYRQTAFSLFRYESVLDVFQECLQVLQKSRHNSNDIIASETNIRKSSFRFTTYDAVHEGSWLYGDSYCYMASTTRI